jgi:hypothetical protein
MPTLFELGLMVNLFFESNKGYVVLEPVESFCFFPFCLNTTQGTWTSVGENSQVYRRHTHLRSPTQVLHNIDIASWQGTRFTRLSWLPHGSAEPPLVFFVAHILQERWYVHPLSHSLWFMSLNEFQFLSTKSAHGILLYLLCMFPVVGLHMFYSMLIILMLVNKYH